MGALEVGMSRTIWLTLLCLAGLGAAMAVRPAAPVVRTVQDQAKAEPAFTLDEAAKSDRLDLPTRAEAAIVVPSSQAMPAFSQAIPLATPSTNPVTISKAEEPHWQDANAMIEPVAAPHRYPKARQSKKIVVKPPPTERAEAWHCRQDTVGSLLRSLDLSPRCNS